MFKFCLSKIKSEQFSRLALKSSQSLERVSVMNKTVYLRLVSLYYVCKTIQALMRFISDQEILVPDDKKSDCTC